MRHLRHRYFRRLSSLLFVALLLVPIALSGHRHKNDATQAGRCAACIVVHHFPAASARVAAHVAPVVVALRLPGSVPAVLASDARPLALGRAPPLASASLPT
jgi:hypothetical protein